MIGSGAVLGNFQARLGLDSTDYAKGMINAESVSRIFGNSFATFVSNPLLGSIGIMKNVGKAFIAGSVEVLGYAESIERLSQQTGASEGLLIALQKRLEIAGFSAERAAQGMSFFNKFIADYNQGGKATNDLVAELGVSLDGIKGTDQLFAAMVEAVSRVEDPAMKASAAMQLFGRMGGPELINAIGGGNAAIDEMIDQYTRLGFVIDGDTNTQLAAMNTNLGFMQQAMEGVSNTLFVEFLTGLSDNADLGVDGIINMAEAIRNNLGPAANDFGEIMAIILPIISEILSLVKGFQDHAEDIFTEIFVANNKAKAALGEVDQFLDFETRSAQKRNRELAAQVQEEHGL
jgi:hypothetical protein